MIIVDDGSDSKVSTPLSGDSESYAPVTSNGGNAGTSLPPPAYSPVDTEANHSTPLQYPYDIPAERSRYPSGENAGHRFIRAFLVALLVWALLAVLTDSIVDVARSSWKRNVSVSGGGVSPVPRTPVEPNLPPPKDKIPGDANNEYVCLYGTDTIRMRKQREKDSQLELLPDINDTNFITADPPPFSVSINYSIPLSSELLSFSNQGNMSYGTFSVNTTTEIEPDATEGQVEVRLSYYKQDAADKSRICYFRNGTKGAEVFVVAPNGGDNAKASDMLRYDIVVKLPQKSSVFDEPLHLNKFHANFTLFRHFLGDLAQQVRFQDLLVQAELFPIEVQSVYAGVGRLQTTHAQISGKFEIEEALELITINQPISATVSLHNADESKPTRLDMSTSNSVLEANIALLSSPSSPSLNTTPSKQLGGAFSVSAVTYNAPISILFASQPPESQLDLIAETSNSPAVVALHPAYEGYFRVATTLLQPRVEFTRTPEDPKGEGRVRDVVLNKLKGKEIVGMVWWEDNQKPEEGTARQLGEYTEDIEERRVVVWEVEHPIEMYPLRKAKGSVQLVSTIMPAVLRL